MKDLVSLAKTKTFWSGVALICYGATLVATGTGTSEEGVKAILEGLAVIFIRDAIRKK